MIRRRPFTSVLLVLLLALLGWAWYERVNLQAFPDIIAAYTAKEYCSCRYVENNPAEYCRGYVKQYVPTSAFSDNPERSEVTASGMGRTHTARWLGDRQGCRLPASVMTIRPGVCENRLVWERACSRKHHRGQIDRPQRLLREQARSHIKPVSTSDRRCSMHQVSA